MTSCVVLVTKFPANKIFCLVSTVLIALKQNSLTETARKNEGKNEVLYVLWGISVQVA